MTVYHIKQDGTPGVCKAKPGNCPLGGAGLHFDSVEQAEHVSQAIMEAKFGLAGESQPTMIVNPHESIVSRPAAASASKSNSGSLAQASVQTPAQYLPGSMTTRRHNESDVPVSLRSNDDKYRLLNTLNTNPKASIQKGNDKITPKEFSEHLENNCNVLLTEDVSVAQMESIIDRSRFIEGHRHMRKLNAIVDSNYADVPLASLPASKDKVVMDPKSYSALVSTLGDKSFKSTRFSQVSGKYDAAVAKGITPRTLRTISKLEGTSKDNTLLQNSVAANFLKRHDGYTDLDLIRMSSNENIYEKALISAGIYRTGSGAVSKSNYTSTGIPMNLTRESLVKYGFDRKKLRQAESDSTSIRLNLNAIASTGATKEQVAKFNSHQGEYKMKDMLAMGFFSK